jgi:hypothetical protein
VKPKMSLVFVELISELLDESENYFPEYSLINEDIFLISSSYTWYRDIHVYLQTLNFPSSYSCDEH